MGGKDEWANAMARLKRVRGMREDDGGDASVDPSSSSSFSGSGGRGPGGKTAILAVNKIDAVEERAKTEKTTKEDGGGGDGDGIETSAMDADAAAAAAARRVVREVVPVHVAESFASVVYISARRGDGLPELEQSLAAVVEGGGVSAEGGAWTANQRQAEAMQTALAALRRLRGNIEDDGLPVDFWTIELREAALALGAITGDDITEDILDVIFTRFCIGK